MDFVDILYLHSIKSREDAFNKPMLEAMKVIKDEGKAKYLGYSTHRNEPDVLQAAIENELIDVVLLAINFKQEHYPQIREKMAEAAKAGIGMIGMKVMAGGYLDKEKTKPVNFKAALKYVLQDPNLHTTIPSMINLEQLQDNASVLTDITLSADEKSDLETDSLEMGLFCNGCSECIDSCVKKLNIPDLMRAYMYTYGYQETVKAKELVARQQYGLNPCISCSDCTVRCTKGFNVAQRIEDISRLSLVPDEFLT
jgi:predicted aldo/keto reductase-like oxidoreductase